MNRIPMHDSQPNSPQETELQNEANRPSLYSKTLIIIFSLLFSPIFAAVLLMSNLKAVDRPKARIYVLIFAIAYLFATAAVLQIFNLPPNLTFIANVIGAAILNEYFWNKYIGRDVTYEKKSWIKPALISVAIALFFLLLLMSLGGNLPQ
ncbi:hypothetical protein SAMN04488034_103156 [Salinimicrobium catena]|uniref:Uncharacterized protein n=1 Tax=Salinimicrobium catena TaxID=390640 RepID=A0A1H5MWC0_9FLAO|nr:hypothetical protein [Salinimicrobium catena]SDL31259.1 hypothetical protein SAMN04488140_103156 [Salinimicrobium catena]SEE93655.1 hypothetical protein SAMN04488034_103156 [Salinimicrobium catena]